MQCDVARPRYMTSVYMAALICCGAVRSLITNTNKILPMTPGFQYIALSQNEQSEGWSYKK